MHNVIEGERTLKVLQIILTVSKEYGGPVEGLIQSVQTRKLVNQSIEVLCLDSPDSPWLADFPCPVHAVGPGIGRYGYTPKLAEWIVENRHRFDAAVIHGLWNHSSIGGWLGCKRSGLPYVQFTHGMMDPWFRKAYPVKHWVKQLFWFVQGKTLRDASEVLFTCEEEKRLAQGVFWWYRYNPKVVAYAASDAPAARVDDDALFQTLVPNLQGRPYLLFLSRIHEKKGCDILLKGFAKADKRSELQLIMAGPCQDGLIDHLKKLAEDLGISSRVHWPGMVKGAAKAAAFRGAEAFILTSHQENFGIAVAEALAHGKPVLISNQINIWREIEVGGAGIIADDTVEGAVKVIQEWENMGSYDRDQMCKNARYVYETRFTVESAAKDLTAALKRAISRQT